MKVITNGGTEKGEREGDREGKKEEEGRTEKISRKETGTAVLQVRSLDK